MKKRINRKFIAGLKSCFKDHPFTTHQAEVYYVVNHGDGDGYFTMMQARDNLSIAASQGLLSRIDRGWYRFIEVKQTKEELALDLMKEKQKVLCLESTLAILQMELQRAQNMIASIGGECVRCKCKLNALNIQPGTLRHCKKCWMTDPSRKELQVPTEEKVQTPARSRWELIELDEVVQ